MTSSVDRPGETEEPLSLEKATTHLLEEARMVLPGIQALFGFQLVSVFNQGFTQKLSPAEQHLHLGATTLVVIAVALVMTPAALHRQLEPRAVSGRLLEVSSRLLLWSMVPLAIGISMDLYLVARILLGATMPAALLAVLVLLIYATLWFGLPRYMRGR
jgi:hypothetical protein